MPQSNQTFRFGVFELNALTGEIRKNGKTGPHLAGQPLELLMHLLERPGDLVSRDELRQRLWPADTFVDYDHSLNAAVNKLREALSDTADNPRFIQTVPRRGYRFIAPVQLEATATTSECTTPFNSPSPSPSPSSIRSDGVAQEAENSRSLLTDPQELPKIPQRHSRFLFALLQVMYLSFYVLAMANLGNVDATLTQLLPDGHLALVAVVVTACIGIPVRLYLLAGILFGLRDLAGRFLKLFPFIFVLDEFWSLSPFLIVNRIGWGLTLAVTATLVFLPFSERSVLLMGEDAVSSNDPHR